MKRISLLLLVGGWLLANPASSQTTVANDTGEPTGPNATFWKELPTGPELFGYFEGRSPCQEIVRLLNMPGREACIKIKWQLVLFQDPVTHVPTTYAIGGFAWRNPPRTGKWAITKGYKEDPNALVYRLDPDDPQGFLSFVKIDDNILYFLDKDGELLVGNEKFSYTLNRAPVN
jgi:hypothetical protein